MINMIIEKQISEIKELFFSENAGKVYKLLLDDLDRSLITKIYSYTGGNQLQTARILGINRNTLRAKMNKLGIFR